ncbi:MAG TPA: hypothetical protein VGH84_13405 [Steroidobacteraceae bacterium]|jgi:hypothetical protein
MFDELDARLREQGMDAVFQHLCEQLKAEAKYHELFDALLMRSRHRLGLPAVLTTSLDDLGEPLRSRVEEAYLVACREVGELLLAAGRLREAWMYLRPTGDKGAMAAALAATEPSEENLQDLIEIGLHEGVAPARGYELVLKNYGTCNAISMFEGALLNRPLADQQAAAALLIDHLHTELVANVRADIARREGREPEAGTLAKLVEGRDWLFAENNYHVDTTHLASTIRFARVIEDKRLLDVAYDLTEYGRRLGEQFQFRSEEPFADLYRSHGQFFAAQLGRGVNEALAAFRAKAEASDPQEHGVGPAEVYIALLARVGRYDEAIEASARLLPAGQRTSGFAPAVYELARLGGHYERLAGVCRERGDVVGYAAALAAGAAAPR